MGNVIGIIGVILFFLVFLPIPIRIKLFYNILCNHGFITIQLFSKFRFKEELYLSGHKVILVQKNGKTKEIDFKPEDQTIISFYENLQKALLKKMIVKKFFLFITIGIRDNAFLTAMLSGTIQTAISIFFSYLSVKKNDSRTITEVNTNFKEEQFSFVWKAKINISIISILFAILESANKRKKEKKRSILYGTRKTS